MKEIVMQRTKNVLNSAVYIYTADAAQSCANDSRLQRIVTDESAHDPDRVQRHPYLSKNPSVRN